MQIGPTSARKTDPPGKRFDHGDLRGIQEQAPAFIAIGEDLKQQLCTAAAERQVAEFIHDQQIRAIRLRQKAIEQVRLLLLFEQVHQSRGSEEADRVSLATRSGGEFRGGQEGAIRRKLIEENLLDAVIGLPANLFYGTGIPAAILIFDRARTANKRKDVLFIDASREFAQEKRQNRLRPEDLQNVVATYTAFKKIEKYAYKATIKEIAENDFNLNIPRHVDTFEAEDEIDIDAVQQKTDGIEAELAKTRKQMAMYLKELEFGS